MPPVCASFRSGARHWIEDGHWLSSPVLHSVFTTRAYSVGLLARGGGPVDPHKRGWVMAITGNSADLSLVDLVQANVPVRNVCRITVAGPAGRGGLFLADGTVVQAATSLSRSGRNWRPVLSSASKNHLPRPLRRVN